jgi:hypothetical protein
MRFGVLGDGSVLAVWTVIEKRVIPGIHAV